jgi:hypothetical protein
MSCLFDSLLLVKGKETGNGLYSRIDHECYLCVDATEVYMILYKWDRSRIHSVVGHRWAALGS